MTRRFKISVSAVLLTAVSVATMAATTAADGSTFTAFVIGDGNSSVGTQVDFWGSDWSTLNTVSGGSATASFKGFAGTVSQTPGTCSGTFVTTPADSASPPATVGPQIEALVVSSVNQSGRVISGTFTDIATVTTDPGYGADTGHAGTGTVVALCSQGAGSTG